MVIWQNGKLVNKEQAVVSVYDHGLLYGDGIFEGMRFYNNQVFRIEKHIARLQDSAKYLQLTIPYNATELADALQQVVNAYDGDSGYIRLLVTRGEGPLGLNPIQCKNPQVIIIADHLAMASADAIAKGLRVIIASTRRNSLGAPDSRVKSLNYLNSILARIEANVAGADEAIVLNHQGYVAEGSAQNLFIVKDGVVKTPLLTDGALGGITRAEVMSCIQELGLPLQECHLTPYDLYVADECFLTGSGARLMPVREIDGRLVGQSPGAVFAQVASAYEAHIAKACGL